MIKLIKQRLKQLLCRHKYTAELFGNGEVLVKTCTKCQHSYGKYI